MDKHDTLPSRDFAFDLLKKVKVPYQVRRHSLRVAEKGLEISEKINKVKINEELIEIGGLLHDIGRAKTHGFDHALIGGRMLRERRFSENLARICETHILGGLDKEDAREIGLPEKDYLPESFEEKIICLADKYIAGTKEVRLEQRFEKWFSKYGKTRILVKAKKRIEQLQKEIESLM